MPHSDVLGNIAHTKYPLNNQHRIKGGGGGGGTKNVNVFSPGKQKRIVTHKTLDFSFKGLSVIVKAFQHSYELVFLFFRSVQLQHYEDCNFISACWLFLCFHNPPISDMDYKIFNVRM